MICIYTDKYTSRFKYIIDHIFKRILKQSVKIVNNTEDIPSDSTTPIIVYSETLEWKNAIHIRPNGLLFKKGVRRYDIDMISWDSEPAFFATKGGDIPFDIFSASFYLLSRYEEYISKEDLDENGYYKSECSLACREGFIDKPIIDIWAYKLEGLLSSKYTDYESSVDRRFRFIPLIAVNAPYRYRTYSILGNFLRLGKKILERDWSGFKSHFRVLLRIDADPYCNISKIVEIHNRNSLRPLFVLRISNKAWYRRPIYFAYRTYKKVLCRNYQIALCSSGRAVTSVSQMKIEQKRLSRIFRMRVVINMCCDSLFDISKLYKNLALCKVKEDFSMSYPDRIGFRASTCTPLRIYDFDKEEYYRIEVHSVPLSDWAAKRMGLNKDEIGEVIIKMANVVKNVNGEFIMNFHNDSFVSSNAWKGWASSYEYSIRYISILETKGIEEAEKVR